METKEGAAFQYDEMLLKNISSFTWAAHELKAPLALVRQLALGLEYGVVHPNDQEKIIRQIVLVSERALRLTSDLTRASRLEDSLFELEPLNPQQLCEEVAHELWPLFKAKQKEIKVVYNKRPPLAVANRELLRRVLLNFGDNALHYCQGDMPVEFKTVRRGDGVRIGVRDFGPAVPSDVWKQLQQGLGTRSQPLHNRPQSSGLGLYIAKQFARAMQGELGATRHRDGATFFIDIGASHQLSLL